MREHFLVGEPTGEAKGFEKEPTTKTRDSWEDDKEYGVLSEAY